MRDSAEHGMRPDLEEHLVTVVGHGVYSVRKTDRVADVAREITAVDALGARERAGHGRVERDTGGRNRNRPEGVDEALLERSHLRAVKRVPARAAAG